MNRSVKIFFIGLILVFITHPGFSLDLRQPYKLSRKTEKNNKPENKQPEPEKRKTDKRQAMRQGEDTEKQKVKQIRGARPDMSKSIGARPPLITRPAGSGIPRGMGKPGGAGFHGGR